MNTHAKQRFYVDYVNRSGELEVAQEHAIDADAAVAQLKNRSWFTNLYRVLSVSLAQELPR